MIIALDESGTHAEKYLVIGALFIPQPKTVHNQLCRCKDKYSYFNSNPKYKAKYRELKYSEIHKLKDLSVAKEWIDVFAKGNCWYRAIVIDWSIWQGKHFGSPFDPDALKKRRAYKKWTEMLLSPEVGSLTGAWLKLDELLVCYGYDVIQGLRDRFLGGYKGRLPRIAKFSKVKSWRDAHQDVQLSDLLTGCIYNSLVPPVGKMGRKKIEAREYLFDVLKAYGVEDYKPSYWKGFSKKTLRDHFPKFSEWFWEPGKK